jgi:hypothetical protein
LNGKLFGFLRREKGNLFVFVFFSLRKNMRTI